MCTVSMVGDHYRETWPNKYPDIFRPPTSVPGQPANPIVDWEQLDKQTQQAVEVWNLKNRIAELEKGSEEDKQTIADLRRDVDEMKALLKRAHQYDIDNDEPHCEMDEKVAILKAVAEALGVDLGDVFAQEGFGNG